MISEQKFQLVQNYDLPISWNVSGFGSTPHVEYFTNLLKTYKNLSFSQEKFPIKYFHGCYCCRFNGGREAMSFATKNEIAEKVNFFNENDIGIKMTLSNNSINVNDFNDSYLNFLLTTLNNGQNNGVICVVDDFAKFIKDTYPNITVTSSMVKTEVETVLGKTDTTDYYNSLLDLYDEVVINTARAFDDNFIDQLKDPSKFEIIVNHSCNLNCPHCGKHHKLIDKLCEEKEKSHLKNELYSQNPEYIKVEKEMQNLLKWCTAEHRKNNIDAVKLQFLNIEEINHLLHKGVNHYKIEGRDLTVFEFFYNLDYYIFNKNSIMNHLYF